MSKNKLSFESENLVVDYISFNIPGSNNTESIAKYLFEKFNFNSTFAKGQNGTTYDWFYLNRNQHQVSFRELEYDPSSKSFWEGTIIHFSGTNAAQFYKTIQAQKFDWNILKLKNASLGRIDIHYLRQSKIIDTNQSIEDFMELSRRRVITKDKRRKASWEYEETALVLRVGQRGSPRYYRVYETDIGLKFEFEFKPSKLLQKLLMDNRIQQFEHQVTKEYYSYSFRSVNLNSPYTDWLLHWYRKWSQKSNFNGFITTYFNQESSTLNNNKEIIFNFLRTLSYIQRHGNKQQKFEIDADKQTFYVVTFRLIDFLRYIKVNEKNHRQRIRIIEIFKHFQYLHDFKLQTFQATLDNNLSFDNNSNDPQFTSVVLIPYFKIKKKRNVWNVTLLVANQFYDYKFPFQFNDYFNHWKNTHQFEIKTQVIQLLAQPTVKKKLDIEKFMKPFEKISNARKTTVKRILIEGIEQEIQNKSIQSKFHIVQKDNSVKYVNQLKPINITKGKFIYFYENINIGALFKII